jgi:hypothetical protein
LDEKNTEAFCRKNKTAIGGKNTTAIVGKTEQLSWEKVQ